MSDFPDTRNSLLIQVADPSNRDAWEQFVQTYRPVIFRIAIARGLQDADANDLSQQVLMAVAKAIGRWKKDGKNTRFRHWLSRVTKNAILNALTRRPIDQAVGGSAADGWLEDVADVDAATEELIVKEYRRELYLRAAKKIKNDVRPETWKAFEMSVVENMPINDVALKLDRTQGAIYTARSRVMFRMRQLVQSMMERDAVDDAEHAAHEIKLLDSHQSEQRP